MTVNDFYRDGVLDPNGAGWGWIEHDFYTLRNKSGAFFEGFEFYGQYDSNYFDAFLGPVTISTARNRIIDMIRHGGRTDTAGVISGENQWLANELLKYLVVFHTGDRVYLGYDMVERERVYPSSIEGKPIADIIRLRPLYYYVYNFWDAEERTATSDFMDFYVECGFREAPGPCLAIGGITSRYIAETMFTEDEVKGVYRFIPSTYLDYLNSLL